MKTHKHGAFDFNQCEECDRERAKKEREYQNPMSQDQQPIATPRNLTFKELFAKARQHPAYLEEVLKEVESLQSERDKLQQRLDEAAHYSNLYIERTDKALFCGEELTCGTCRGCLLEERDKLRKALETLHGQFDDLLVVLAPRLTPSLGEALNNIATTLALNHSKSTTQ